MTQSNGKTFVGKINLSIVLFVLLLIGLGLRLHISWLEMPLLFEKCVVDDAFFYLGIAKNIAAGNGASFDGSIMTNGFHPTYALLLVPIYWIFPHNLDMPLHWALTILSIFNVLTGIVIFMIVREIAGRLAGLFGSFIWLFNPYVIMISLSGVEVTVAAFFLSLCIYQYIKMCNTDIGSARKTITLGCLTALAILSRVDAVFMFMSISMSMFYLSYRKEKNVVKALLQPARFIATTFAVLSPWFLWNIYNFGTIRQISGVTLPNIAHNMYLAKYNTYLSVNFIKTELFYLVFWVKNIIRFSGGIFLVAIVLVGYIWVCRRSFLRNSKELLSTMKIINFALVSVIMLVLFYALYFWGWLRPWYYLSIVLVVTIYLGIIAGYKQSAFLNSNTGLYKQAIHIIILLSVISVYFSYYGFHVWKKGIFPFQKQLYESAVWLKQNTDESSKIGAISAGIYGYMTDRTIDLAGVVNEEAYTAMRDRIIFSYLKEKNIEYLVDREDMVKFYSERFDCSGFMDALKPVKRFGDKASDIVVYRIVR